MRLPELRKWPTWDDRRWQEALRRLQPSQQFVLRTSVRDLLTALSECNDPRRDEALRPWFPSKWHSPFQQTMQGEWTYYRLGDNENRGRAVICYEPAERIIHLVARTALHDSVALRELVAGFTIPRRQ